MFNFSIQLKCFLIFFAVFTSSSEDTFFLLPNIFPIAGNKKTVQVSVFPGTPFSQTR